DHRWIHVLGPIVGAEPEPAPAAVDREVVLAGGAADRDARVLAGYEQVAEQPLDPAEPHPFDAWLVARLAGLGPIVDVGCGTGWASGLLAAMDAQVTGVDRSPAMVAAAAAAHPGARFETGDLTRLLRPPAAPAWGAIIAWDVFGHLAGSELDEAVAALVRVLAPEGWLLLAVRIGNEVLPTDHYLGHEVEVPLVLHDPDRVRQAVTGAGLSIAERYVRGAQEADEADLLVLMAYTPAVTG
ncbi:MAG: class I SAM-dependent methyltransferase, partial [Propionibacterium sp.]|nr:class I SAM-dependent methyltransferase [Propionibacterium sp.]